jgi:hypothetical protein
VQVAGSQTFLRVLDFLNNVSYCQTEACLGFLEPGVSKQMAATNTNYGLQNSQLFIGLHKAQ